MNIQMNEFHHIGIRDTTSIYNYWAFTSKKNSQKTSNIHVA
jgi:hypothetical protein